MVKNGGGEHSDNNNDNLFTTKRTTQSTSNNVLSLMDSFIEQIFDIKRTLRGVSISAIILAPIAIGLCVFLLQHPSFFAILEIENEFGLVLGALLGAVIIISSIWLVTGIRQYRLIDSWNKRYEDYIREKQEIDRKIASQYSEDVDR